jgi:hypothetical protein
LQIVGEIRVTSAAAGSASRRNTGFRPRRGNFGPRGGQKYQKSNRQDQNHCDQRGGLARNANSHSVSSAQTRPGKSAIRPRISEAIGKKFKE